MFRLGHLLIALVVIVLSTGCSSQFYRVPPPTATVDDCGRVQVSYPSPGRVTGQAILAGQSPELYERTRNRGTELSDGWVEFEIDQEKQEFILVPNGEVAEAFVKYKEKVEVRKISRPNWNFHLINQYNSGTRDYELWFRYEDGSEQMVTVITVVSSPSRALQSKGHSPRY